MTTHKKDTFSKSTNATGDVRIAENSTVGLAPSQEQMTAYLYGLLGQEESLEIEQRVEQSEAYREALDASQEAQALFAYWEDVPAPVGLADRVLQQITDIDPDSSSPASSSSSSES